MSVFVTGGSGFIGRQIVRELVASGASVQALARSEQAAQSLKALGAEAVLGDLEKPGDWQARVRAAARVIHAAQPTTPFGVRLTAARAEGYRSQRQAQDRALLDALDPASRLVYVSGNSYFGETGAAANLDETMARRPTGFGPYIEAAVDEVKRRIERGLDAVIGFPGAVYGDGSWLAEYTLGPLRAGKPVNELSGRSHFASPVAVSDVARAAIFLSEQPKLTDRLFFIVDDEPITFHEINEIAAAALGVKAKYRRVPGFMMRLFAGKVALSYMQTDARYSNQRLKKLGFAFRHPTAREGIPAELAQR